MKTKFTSFIIFFLSFSFMNGKQPLSLPLLNTNDYCDKETKIWLIDANSDNIYDILFYINCVDKSMSYSLLINSSNEVNESETAFLTSGSLENNNFSIFLYDSISMKYKHKIQYNTIISKAILTDYKDNDNGKLFSDDADNYFSTYIFGNTIRLIKITDIQIKAIKLCTLEGNVLDNKQIYDNQSEYFFDLFGQPTGMYFIWILTNDKVFVKKIIYTP